MILNPMIIQRNANARLLKVGVPSEIDEQESWSPGPVRV